MPLVVPIRPTAIEPLPGAYPACPVMAYALESWFNGFAATAKAKVRWVLSKCAAPSDATRSVLAVDLGDARPGHTRVARQQLLAAQLL